MLLGPPGGFHTPGRMRGMVGVMLKPQTNATAGAASGATGGKPVRRILQCEGVPGVLEQRAGVWTICNDYEVQHRSALGKAQAVSRLRALVATLNSGLVDSGQGLTRLNKKLRAIARAPREQLREAGAQAADVRDVYVGVDLRPAVAYACTHLPDANGTQWLAWMFAARLDGNLSRWWRGPGWGATGSPSQYWEFGPRHRLA